MPSELTVSAKSTVQTEKVAAITLLRVRSPTVVPSIALALPLIVLPSSFLTLFAGGAKFSTLGDRVSSFPNAKRALLRLAGRCVDMVRVRNGERVATVVIDAGGLLTDLVNG